MNIKDFKVGQTVYIELDNNAARGKSRDESIEEWEIDSVGRKYIKAHQKDGWHSATFELWNNGFHEKSKYSSNYNLYPTKKEILDKFERIDLLDNIRSSFGFGAKKDFTLDQLRRINEIIEESEET